MKLITGRVCALLRILFMALIVVCLLYWFTRPAPDSTLVASLKAELRDLKSVGLSKRTAAGHKSASVSSQDEPRKLHPWVHVYDLHQPNNDTFECVPLKAMFGTPIICIHPVKKDRVVSMRIKNKGIHEKRECDLMQNILQQNPTMNVADLGANIGQFSILAANMGRKVLAIDPMLENACLLHRSAQLNGVQDNITLIMNGLSNSHTILQFSRKINNVAATRLNLIDSPTIDEKEFGINLTRSVLLDDLVPLCHSQTLFIKMDIEGNEVRAIRGGKKFFLQNDIRYVMVEMNKQYGNPDADHMIDFFSSYGLEAHTLKMVKLDVGNFRKWKFLNVIWIKQSSQYNTF